MHTQAAPLPTRDGISPSYIWLPEGQWRDLLEFLGQQFPDISETRWLQRIAKGEVVDLSGKRLLASSEVKRGMCIFYYRELEDETEIPFQANILFQDQDLVVVDKPHFLPVTPGGRFLRETLLVRIKAQLKNDHLSPLHRLDRETAGVILFSCNPSTRGAYQSLFQQRTIDKTYHALAPYLTEISFPHTHESRMIESQQFFVMQEISGEANSSTHITLLERRGANSLYELKPSTGKKHQLRLHLASLGAPIVNDAFYPIALPCKGDDFSSPLQLLAKSIAFIDPINGKQRYFESLRSL
ncbi:MAG: pseudouridine synthase [Undibacterium sp.]|nr:pseudouridine synthase [Undibacterium sp.]